MRALFLLLLLANLLFAAWSVWVAPVRAPADGKATPSAAGTDGIRLLRELEIPAAGGSVAAALDLSDASLACVSAGPYLERPDAEQAESRLTRLGFAVRVRESREAVRTGDWVRIENLATPEDAANALAQIKAAGISDAYVLTEEGPGTVVSLGVFTDKAGAGQAEAIARMTGFTPSTIERTRMADVFWLDIDREASAGLPSPEQLGAGRPDAEPAIGLRRCPVPASAAADEPAAGGPNP